MVVYVAILNKVVGGEGMSQAATGRKSIPVRGNSPCKADGQSMLGAF